jgi:Protein of unknown function (DUF3631)
VADAAGGIWPQTARDAAVALVADSKRVSLSLGIMLLTDLRLIFGDADALPTDTILDRLIKLEESPWGDLRGKPLDARGLSHRLRPYGSTPKTIRVGDKTPKGYSREDCHDPWSRYLGDSPIASATSATSETGSLPVADVADVLDSGATTEHG